MRNTYFVRTHNNRLDCFFYTNELGICYKTVSSGSFGEIKTIVSNSQENYTVSIGENGLIYIFYIDRNGHICCCSQVNKTWKKETIFKTSNLKTDNLLFYPIISSGLKKFILLYSMFDDESKSYELLAQQQNPDNSWNEPIVIDKIANFKNENFHFQSISDDKKVVFYQLKGNENIVGFREIIRREFGDFNRIHSTNYPLTDYSFLTSEKNIHMVYLVKNMFSSQLYYRMKNSSIFTSPVLLADGQRIENCLITIVKNVIYITYSAMGNLFAVTSHDGGKTFTKSSKYNDRICTNYEKAYYITQNKQEANNFICNEVYVNSSNRTEIQIIGGLVEDFFQEKEETILNYKSAELEDKPIGSVLVNDGFNKKEEAKFVAQKKEITIIQDSMQDPFWNNGTLESAFKKKLEEAKNKESQVLSSDEDNSLESSISYKTNTYDKRNEKLPSNIENTTDSKQMYIQLKSKIEAEYMKKQNEILSELEQIKNENSHLKDKLIDLQNQLNSVKMIETKTKVEIEQESYLTNELKQSTNKDKSD